MHRGAPPPRQPSADGVPEPFDQPGTSRPALWSRLSRFFLWWLIFSGIYASSSVCPFCGQAGCPGGGASAGVVGGLFAFLAPGVTRLLTCLKRPLPWRRSALGSQKTDS